MSRFHVFGASALCLLAAIGFALPAIHREEVEDGPVKVQQPIPNFPSPVDMTTLERPALRANRWQLFVNLTSKGGKSLPKPLWETWYTKCDLDLSPLCPEVSADKKHAEFVGSSPQLDTSNGGAAKRFSVVYYSPVAADFIKAQGVNQAKSLQQMITKPSATGPFQFPQKFPKESIIVKEIWEGFNDGPSNSAEEVVHVYDPSLPQALFNQRYVFKDGSLNPVVVWPTVKLKNRNGVLDKADCPAKDFPLDATVPLGCFYSQSFPPPCMPYMQTPSGLQIQPATVGHCVVVLVGVQIMTREVGNWAWSTFWWTNQPGKILTLNVNDGPPMPSQYRHYMMQTTVGFSSAQSVMDYPVYNPYLEGPKAGGTTRDCVECHGGAQYDPRCVVGKGCEGHKTGHRIDAEGKEGNDQNPALTQAPGPCVLRQLPNNAPCLLRTDLVWSLATSQDENTNQPVLDFVHGFRRPLAPQNPTSIH